MKLKAWAAAAAALFAFAPLSEALAGRDLDQIRQRGTLRCGVQGPSNPGFGVPDSQGRWQGFNVGLLKKLRWSDSLVGGNGAGGGRCSAAGCGARLSC